MSKRICERCKSENVIEDTYYGGTQYYECQNCLRRGDKDNFPEMTIFHQITASPEVLAAEMVFWGHDKDSEWYTSHLLDEDYRTEAEAISATLAKLKEIVE